MNVAEKLNSKNVIEREFKSSLRCDLTKEELDSLAGRLAEEQLELEQLEDQKKAVMKDYAGKIEAVQARIRSGSNTYRQKWEMREVDCVEVKDFDDGTVRSFRTDTFATLNIRKMTGAELERSLPIDGMYN